MPTRGSLVHDLVHLHDDDAVVEGRRLDLSACPRCSDRCRGCPGGRPARQDQRDVGHQVDEHPRVELDIRVNGADLDLPVLEELRRRTLCGPAKARSSLRAMPQSNSVRCSGRLTLEISRCKSWIFAGSTWTSERERKSACFWLSPSRATASPGSRSACSARRWPGFQHMSLHPGDPGQASGLLRPAVRPGVGLSGERNWSIHLASFQRGIAATK